MTIEVLKARVAELEAAMPVAVYQDLWSGLNEWEDAYGKSERVETARAWLKARGRGNGGNGGT